MDRLLRLIVAGLLAIAMRVPLVRRRIARRMFRMVPHSRALGFHVLSAGRGRVIARVPYQPALVGNPMDGFLHAGVLTSLIDQTSGAAAFLSLTPPDYVATLDLRIDHLRAAPPGRALIAEAHCYHITGHILFVRCKAHDGDPGDPVATSVSCFMRVGAVVDNLPGARRRRASSKAH